MSDRSPLAWGHVNLNVSDLERSIAFYSELGFDVFMPGIPYLGLVRDAIAPLAEAPARALGLPEGRSGRGCILQLGDGFPKLDLIEWADEGAAPPATNAGRGFVRICLASRDLHADHARLVAAGVDFETPPLAMEKGLAEVATCRDPDGALIELIQIDPARWAAEL